MQPGRHLCRLEVERFKLVRREVAAVLQADRGAMIIQLQAAEISVAVFAIRKSPEHLNVTQTVSTCVTFGTFRSSGTSIQTSMVGR
jgi:hypothetical protein